MRGALPARAVCPVETAGYRHDDRRVEMPSVIPQGAEAESLRVPHEPGRLMVGGTDFADDDRHPEGYCERTALAAHAGTARWRCHGVKIPGRPGPDQPPLPEIGLIPYTCDRFHKLSTADFRVGSAWGRRSLIRDLEEVRRCVSCLSCWG